MATVIQYRRVGGPDVLELVEVDLPAPAPGEVAVRIEAAGVNPVDDKLRGGFRGPATFDVPRRVGADGAGVVTAVGAEVEGVRIGDEVVLFSTSGTYASDVVVPVSSVALRPPQASAAVGASIGIPVATAYQSLRSLDVRAGDTLLLHGGSGAVGQAAIQFAVLWGATVIATSSPRRFDRVRALGAVPVAYGEGLVARVREAAPQGITVALDAAGTDEALDASVALVDDRTRVATIVRGADAAARGIRAFAGGSPEPLTARQTAWRQESIPVVLNLLAAGAFSVELGPEFALADAADAHRAVKAGTDGKITVVP